MGDKTLYLFFSLLMMDIKIFTENIEEDAKQLLYDFGKTPETKDMKVRIMPDVHLGEGIVIGFTAKMGEYVKPQWIGVDIGCCVSAMFFLNRLPENKYEEFEKRVRAKIPTGMDLQDETQFNVKDFIKRCNIELHKHHMEPAFLYDDELVDWCKKRRIDYKVFCHSIGTLGGGNHFMEYDEGMSSSDAIFGGCGGDMMTPINAFICHTGSRNIGLKVEKYWENIADNQKVGKEIQKKIIKEVREKYPDQKERWGDLIHESIGEYKKTVHPGFLYGENLDGYLKDMVIAQFYSRVNHETIHHLVAKIYKDLTGSDEQIYPEVFTVHNYIDFDDWVIRKGAIRADKDMPFLLPLNMATGTALCVGLGNEDWNCSCSHGAGRKMSRRKSKETLSVEEFRGEMNGIYSTTVGPSTLDESPMAYKDPNEILGLIEPTAKVCNLIKPRINIKDAKTL